MGENKIKGKVNGPLVTIEIERYTHAMFSMELKESIPDTPLKTGDSIVVNVVGSTVYVRIGDEVEVVGNVKPRKIKRREGVIIYMIKSKGLFNETLGFTTAY